MNIQDIADKKYRELNEEETQLFRETLDKFNATNELKDKIFISLLFDNTIKESMKGL